MNIFIFTTSLNSWNTEILNSLLNDKNLSIKGIYFGKPQGGDNGFRKKAKRLFDYGIDNLTRILYQRLRKKTKPNNSPNINSLKKRLKNIPTYTGNEFEKCLELSKNTTDICILIFFNRIIPKKYVSEINMINIHPSLLPHYKGVQPIFWALLNDEKELGITIHKIDKGIDTGPIYDQIKFPVKSNSIHENMLTASRLISLKLPKTLELIFNNVLKPKEQSKNVVDYYSRPKSSDIRCFFKLGKRYY